ncbi:MAG: type II toxin-antitoxin system VapB family antitoxin [Limnohabitans sp.]|jgi:antitoxin ParD1/3/4|nr:type II toxin-antitoxin system VapB family antitoxin [Limnohabitans sp.]MDP4771240.1 type II toxin-antitoxin system VapB family antitoxin [Limnohabitans sp.]MDP4922408.1 type II toxin-antitoxin system VapB family antitoxin [Limnohabitans sp.]
MRTNIEIDDDLMAAAMAAGGFKTKKEAVEEGLRLVRRRQVYNGLLALRGKLEWDDSDAAWAQAHTTEDAAMAVQEPQAAYGVKAKPAATTGRSGKAKKPAAAKRSKAP